MFEYRKLKAKIIEMFGSQKEFAKVLKTSENTVSRKMNGEIQFSHADMVKWSELLGIEQSEIGQYFFG